MCIASVPDRRALLTLVLATGVLGLARPLCAQNEPEAEARLLTNLLTRMAVEVELGRRRALFVIDTGAERTSISDRLAAEL